MATATTPTPVYVDRPTCKPWTPSSGTDQILAYPQTFTCKTCGAGWSVQWQVVVGGEPQPVWVCTSPPTPPSTTATTVTVVAGVKL